MKHQIFDERGVLAHEVDDGKPEREPPVRVQRLVGPISVEHPEAKCEDCGGANVVWHAPSPIWNKVCRPAGYRCDPMICPTCFIIRAEKAGINSTSWRVCPEDWPNVQIEGLAATSANEGEKA